MTKFQVTNEAAVLAAIREKALKLENAGRAGVMAVAFAVQKQAKINAFTGKHAPGDGHIFGTGPGPNVGTGMLRRSISVRSNKKGFGNYVASVGPTVVYSRAVELGHPRWKSGVKYPYLRPAGTLVRKKARRIFLATFNEKSR
jgi:hypothetical protein